MPNQRFGTVFLLFLGFFGGAEGLQALLDEVGDGAAADAVVKVVALEVEIRGVVVLIADGLKDFLEGARLHDLAEGVDVLDALARDVLDAQTAAVIRHQPALAAELLDGEADGNTAHAVFYGELALGAIGVLCHEKIWFPTLPGNVMNAWTYNFPVQFQFLREVDNKMIFAGEEAAYERILEGCKELLGKAEEIVREYPETGAFLLECTEMPPYAYLIQAATQCQVYDFITMLNWVHSGLCRRPVTGWV